MRVVFTDAARGDLFAIGDHIARDNALRALSFVEELEEHCFSLSGFPRSHPLLSDHRESGIRRAVHGNYGIFYTVGETVNIVHVLNSAVDYKRILFPDD